MDLSSDKQETIHDDLKSAIRSFKKKKGADKKKQDDNISVLINNAHKNLKRYQKLINQYKADEEEKRKDEKGYKKKIQRHERKIGEYRDEFQKIKSDFEKAKNQGARDELYDGAEEEELSEKQRSRERKVDKNSDLNEDMAKKLFSEIYEVQDENLEIVLGLIKKADKAQQLGADINVKLSAQNQQMKKVSSELDTLQGTIKRARAEVISFIRGIQTDKCLSVCICLVLLTVLVLIIGIILCKPVGLCKIICKVVASEEKCASIPFVGK